MIVGKTSSAVQDIELKDLPHRYQRIKTPNQMVFINDSKATNLTAKICIKKNSSPYVLILYGDPDKEQYESYKIIGPKRFIFLVIMQKKYQENFHPEK